jgi:hypothetical protein
MTTPCCLLPSAFCSIDCAHPWSRAASLQLSQRALALQFSITQLFILSRRISRYVNTYKSRQNARNARAGRRKFFVGLEFPA